MDYPRAVHRNRDILIILAAFLGKSDANKPLPPPQNERQWSIKDYWSCILDNARAVQRLYCIPNMVAAIMGKDGSVHITITF
jgi:hypothetical protein